MSNELKNREKYNIVANFLAELSKLSEKYNIFIGGCGCCGSPYLEYDFELESESDEYGGGWMPDFEEIRYRNGAYGVGYCGLGKIQDYINEKTRELKNAEDN